MMNFNLFKALSLGVADDIKTKQFLNSIKNNDKITISSNCNSMDFDKDKILPLLDGLIEQIDKELQLLKEDMIKGGYIIK